VPTDSLSPRMTATDDDHSASAASPPAVAAAARPGKA
jgi:hypothetical protein